MNAVTKWLGLALLMVVLAACNVSDEGDSDDNPTIDPSVQLVDDVPQVTINSPATGSEVVVNSEVLIYSIARDSVGVTRVELLQNDQVIDTVNSPEAAGQTNLAVLQTWTPTALGEQTLQVVAYRGNTRGDPASVTLQIVAAEADVETPVLTPTFIAPVPTEDTTCRIRINVDGLGARAQPSGTANTIATVNIGEGIPIIGRTADNQWFEVNVAGQRGWIDATFVTQLGDCADIPVTGEVAQQPTNTPTETPDPTICRAEITSSMASVHLNPDATTGVVSTVENGTAWRIFQRTNAGDWWQISVNGVLGWVIVDNIAVTGECSNVLVATATPQPNREPVIAPLASRTLEIGEALTVVASVTDPDGDSLTLSVTSADDGVASAVLVDATGIEITGVTLGVTTITVTVADSNGGAATETFAVAVVQPEPENQAPLLAAIPDVTVTEGQTITAALSVVDPEGDTLDIDFAVADATIATVEQMDDNIEVAGLSVGETDVTVTVDDGNGGSANTAFTIIVEEEPNSPPTIEAIQDQTMEVGESRDLSIVVDDPDADDETTVSAVSNDTAAVVASITETGDLALSALAEGDATITLTVSDSAGATAETDVFVTVNPLPTAVPNDPPVIDPIAPQTVILGDQLTVTLSVTDPEGQTPIVVVDSSNSAIVGVELDGNGDIVLSGNALGQATIAIVADDDPNDDDDGRASATFTVLVIESTQPNQPPLVDSIPAQTIPRGESVTVSPQITDPEGTTTFYDAITSAAETIATAESDDNANIIITGVALGTTTITLIIEDGGGAQTTVAISVTVVAPTPVPNDPPTISDIADQSIEVGETVTLTPTIEDPEGTVPFYAELTSAANTIAGVGADGDQGIEVTGIAPGTTTITVVVEDGTGLQTTTTFEVSVGQPSTATPVPNDPPTISALDDLTIEVGETVTLTPTIEDPEGTVPFYAELTSAADTIAGVASDGDQGIAVTGIAPGTTAITVVVEDGTGLQTTVDFSVMVVEPTPVPNDPPTISTIEDQRLDVGETIALTPTLDDPEGTVPFYAEITSAAETIALAETVGNGVIEVTGVAEGTTTITVIVEDGDGQQTTVTFSVTVSVAPTPTPFVNQPPVVSDISDQTVVQGDSVTLTPTLTDPEGTVPFYETLASASDTIAAVSPDGQGGITITGISAGTTTIRVVVEDGDGGQTTVIINVTVADPTPVPNDPPTISAIEDQSIFVDETVSLTPTLDDPEGTIPFYAEITSAAETIAIVESDGGGNITVTGIAPGATTVTVIVEDGDGRQTTTTFSVVVTEAPTPTPFINEPPTITDIPDQTVVVGQSVTVTPTLDDPEGTVPFYAEITSAAETIATATVDGDQGIVVDGLAPGTTVITVLVEDGDGGQTTADFSVTVVEPTPVPNDPPTISTIEDQTIVVGESVTVTPTITDPEGTVPFYAELISAADTIASVGADGDQGIEVTGIAPGTTTITVVVEDGTGLQTTTDFSVTIIPAPTATPVPNDPPTIDAIADQTVAVGQTVTVIVNANDPEGFQPILIVESAAETIATGAPDGQGDITITGNAPGTTTITVIADDTNGLTASVDFTVTVPEPPTATPMPDEPPTFDTGVPDQTVNAGEFTTIGISATDPEGAVVNLSVVSSDEGIATAQLGEGNLTLQGVAPGSATITVTADDGNGNIASLVFNVTVNESAPPPIDLNTLPIIPEVSVGDRFPNGNPSVFSVVGDITPAQLLAPAGDGNFDLSGAPELDGTLQIYLNQPLGDGNVLNRAGLANGGWTSSDLLNPANNPEGCGEATPVACEIAANDPRIVVIFIGRNDALAGVPLTDFESNLRAIVEQVTGRGVIPVLVTLPGDARVDAYNQVIARLAIEQTLPLWNLWRSIPAEQVNGNLSLTSPGDGQNALITADNVANFGAVKRNADLLTVLGQLQ